MSQSVLRTIGRYLFADLDTVILFVTSHCDARCKHCFYWELLNRRDDMTIEEMERIAATSGRVRSLALSGGEPFLRSGIARVCGAFHDHAGVLRINIPTNGLKTGAILERAGEILERCPRAALRINVSLDGPAELHDRIRQVPGNYLRACETLRALLALRATRPALKVYATTVVCGENRAVAADFVRRFRLEFALDGHNVEVIRGSAPDPLLNEGREGLADSFMEAAHAGYAAPEYRRQGRAYFGHGPLSGVLDFLASASHLYQVKLKYENLRHGRHWGFECIAGRRMVAIDHNGRLRACELREPVVDLRDFRFDLRAALRARDMARERASIRKDRCFCTHGCFLSASLGKAWWTRLVKAPWYLLRRGRPEGYPAPGPPEVPGIPEEGRRAPASVTW